VFGRQHTLQKPMETLLLKYGYVVLFLGVALEGEAFLLAGAFLAHRAYFHLIIVIVVAIAANCIADQVYYMAARTRGRNWLERRFGKHRPKAPNYFTQRLAHFVTSLSYTPVVLVLFAFVASEFGFAESLSNIALRGNNQQLHLYGSREGSPVILSSGDLGWAGLVTHVAEFLSDQGYFIVGFNSRAYLESFTSMASALKPQDVPQDYRALIDFGAQGSSSRPILAGVSEGAGLSVLAATDPLVRTSVRGVLGLGLPDQNELGWKWQDFTIWITKKTPNEPSFMVEDIIAKMSPLPLAEIHSTHDEFLPLEQAKTMFARAGEPKRMWAIEAANHRFSNNRVELNRVLLEALEWIKNPR
jgi:virulence protein VirJ